MTEDDKTDPLTAHEPAEQERPEWVKCIRRSRGLSWCGRYLGVDWAFVDLAHAAAYEGRMVPCQRCRDVAQLAQSEGPTTSDDAADASVAWNDLAPAERAMMQHVGEMLRHFDAVCTDRRYRVATAHALQDKGLLESTTAYRADGDGFVISDRPTPAWRFTRRGRMLYDEHEEALRIERASRDAALPCPFCGVAPEVNARLVPRDPNSSAAVRCENPACELRPYVLRGALDAALEAWNRRAPEGDQP